jgi:hypothetical protein
MSQADLTLFGSTCFNDTFSMLSAAQALFECPIPLDMPGHHAHQLSYRKKRRIQVFHKNSVKQFVEEKREISMPKIIITSNYHHSKMRIVILFEKLQAPSSKGKLDLESHSFDNVESNNQHS